MAKASQVVVWSRTCLPMQETQERWVPLLGWKDPLEKEMATHSSILALKISWTEEPGRLQSMGSQSWTDCMCAHTHTYAHTQAVVNMNESVTTEEGFSPYSCWSSVR